MALGCLIPRMRRSLWTEKSLSILRPHRKSHANPLIIRTHRAWRLCICVSLASTGPVLEGIQATTACRSRACSQNVPVVSNFSPIRSGRDISPLTGATGSNADAARVYLPSTLGCSAVALVEKLSTGSPTRRAPCKVTLRQAAAQCKGTRANLRSGQFHARSGLYSNSHRDTRSSPSVE